MLHKIINEIIEDQLVFVRCAFTSCCQILQVAPLYV